MQMEIPKALKIIAIRVEAVRSALAGPSHSDLGGVGTENEYVFFLCGANMSGMTFVHIWNSIGCH